MCNFLLRREWPREWPQTQRIRISFQVSDIMLKWIWIEYTLQKVITQPYHLDPDSPDLSPCKWVALGCNIGKNTHLKKVLISTARFDEYDPKDDSDLFSKNNMKEFVEAYSRTDPYIRFHTLSVQVWHQSETVRIVASLCLRDREYWTVRAMYGWTSVVGLTCNCCFHHPTFVGTLPICAWFNDWLSSSAWFLPYYWITVAHDMHQSMILRGLIVILLTHILVLSYNRSCSFDQDHHCERQQDRDVFLAGCSMNFWWLISTSFFLAGCSMKFSADLMIRP